MADLLTPGTRLGPYEIEGLIGAGGMGQVYRARDPRLGRHVAIKTLAGADAHDLDRVRRFETEARAAGALDHPNLLTVYDVGREGEIAFIVSELLDGETFRTRLEQGPLPERQAIDYGVQIARGLAAAHARGIVHRDLKPENLFLTRDGRVKILDFGVAKLTPSVPSDAATATALTGAGMVVGTVGYMAPEQAQGRAVDARSDIFSVGAVFYEMLSGARAFGGDTMADVLSAILRDEPRPLRTGAAIERVVTRCLSKTPGDRFRDASELAFVLEKITASPGAQPASIVVLPFANMSRDSDDEYFSDGLAEEIINALAQIPALKVIARTSAFAFKGQHTDIRRIAETLGVTTVLEGSVRRNGSRLRVTAQLINAADGTHIWLQRYDREMADVFDIQDDIARAIASALQVTLALETKRHTPSLPAYDAFLRGRFQLFTLTAGGWQRARASLQQAIDLDPLYPQPLVTLGFGYLLVEASGLEDLRVAAPQIRALAERALEIAPANPEPRFLLGAVAVALEYDWPDAARQFHLAFAAPTVSAEARWAYASLYLQPLGRNRESVAEMRRAVEQDPLNVSYRAIAASHMVHAGMYDEALVEVRQALEIDEHNFAAGFVTVEAYLASGSPPKALAAAEHAYRSAPWASYLVGTLAGLRAQSGDVDGAEELVRQLDAAPDKPFSRVLYHLLVGEIAAAAAWYERAIAQRELFAIFMIPAPIVKPLRASPHWARLATLMRLPSES